jgi:hypothetical protein
MQTICALANLSSMAKRILEYYAKIFPSSAGPYAVAQELGLNRNSVRGVVQALGKAGLLVHPERGLYRASEDIVDARQADQDAGSRAGMPEKADGSKRGHPVDVREVTEDPGVLGQMRIDRSVPKEPTIADAPRSETLRWLILVRFSMEEKPEIEALCRKLGLKSLSSTIRAAALAACRQESCRLFDQEAVPYVDLDRIEEILTEIRSLKGEIQDLKNAGSIVSSIERADVETRALAILLDPANRDEVAECVTEQKLEEYLFRKDPVLKMELTRELNGVVPLESLLTMLHVRGAVDWKERLHTLDWDLRQLKALSEDPHCNERR